MNATGSYRLWLIKEIYLYSENTEERVGTCPCGVACGRMNATGSYGLVANHVLTCMYSTVDMARERRRQGLRLSAAPTSRSPC